MSEQAPLFEPGKRQPKTTPKRELPPLRVRLGIETPSEAPATPPAPTSDGYPCLDCGQSSYETPMAGMRCRECAAARAQRFTRKGTNAK